MLKSLILGWVLVLTLTGLTVAQTTQPAEAGGEAVTKATATAEAKAKAEPAKPEMPPEKVYEALFAEMEASVKRTRDGADDVELAMQIVEAAGTDGISVPLQVLFSEKAYELSIRHRDGYDVAADAMMVLRDLGKPYEMKGLEGVVDVRQKQFTTAMRQDKKDAATTYFDALTALALAQEQAANPAAAQRTWFLARGVSSYVGPDARAMVNENLKRLPLLVRNQRELERLIKSFETEPTAELAKQIVMLYIEAFDAQAEAVKYLEATADEKLQALVPLAAAEIEDVKPDQGLELGMWYADLGSAAAPNQKGPLLVRARVYLDIYLSSLASNEQQGLTYLKAKTTFDRVERALETMKYAGGSKIKTRSIDLQQPIAKGMGQLLEGWLANRTWTMEGRLIAGRLGNMDMSAGPSLHLPIEAFGDYTLEIEHRSHATSDPEKHGRGYVVHFPVGEQKAYVRVGIRGDAGEEFPKAGDKIGSGKMAEESRRTPKGWEKLGTQGMSVWQKPMEKDEFRKLKIEVKTRGEKSAVKISVGGDVLLEWAGPTKQLGDWDKSPANRNPTFGPFGIAPSRHSAIFIKDVSATGQVRPKVPVKAATAANDKK